MTSPSRREQEPPAGHLDRVWPDTGPTGIVSRPRRTQQDVRSQDGDGVESWAPARSWPVSAAWPSENLGEVNRNCPALGIVTPREHAPVAEHLIRQPFGPMVGYSRRLVRGPAWCSCLRHCAGTDVHRRHQSTSHPQHLRHLRCRARLGSQGVMLDWVAQWSLLLGIGGLAWTIAYIAPRNGPAGVRERRGPGLARRLRGVQRRDHRHHPVPCGPGRRGQHRLRLHPGTRIDTRAAVSEGDAAALVRPGTGRAWSR
jgi:hypothetical protein